MSEAFSEQLAAVQVEVLKPFAPLHRAASDIHHDGLTPRVSSPLLGSHVAIQRQDT